MMYADRESTSTRLSKSTTSHVLDTLLHVHFLTIQFTVSTPSLGAFVLVGKTTSTLLCCEDNKMTDFHRHEGNFHDLVLMKAKDDSVRLFFFSTNSFGMFFFWSALESSQWSVFSAATNCQVPMM